MKVGLDLPPVRPVLSISKPPTPQASAAANGPYRVEKHPAGIGFGRGRFFEPSWVGAAAGPFLKTLGMGGGLLGTIAGLMSYIEASQTTQLMTIDVAGFVLPRTASEGYHRGVDAGREAFIRESMGTICNVYLAGWLGMAALLGGATAWKNPKALNLKAWLPAGRLEYFGNIVQETLHEARRTPMTSEALKSRFLEKALARIESSDGIAKLPEYREVFPSQGKLAPAVQTQLRSLLMGGEKGFDHARNIDQAVMVELQTPQTLAGWKQRQTELIESFRRNHHLDEHDLLSSAQKRILRKQLDQARSGFFESQYRSIRQQLSAALRHNEKPFIDHLYKLAVKQGGLTDDIILNNAAGHQVYQLGRVGLNTYLQNLKHFMEEYLNRALVEPFGSKPLANKLLPTELKAISQCLFKTAPKTQGLLGRIMPGIQDGLLAYTYKTHGLLLVSALLGTMAAGCSVAYFNHRVTKKRHKGAVFFPGERYQEERLRRLQGGQPV